MPKFLWQVSYMPEGAMGLLREGGTSRREMVEKMLADHGGTLEAFYFAFGDDDVYVIADLPDQATAAAISLAVGAAGAARVKTTVLLAPEEIDRAAHTTVAYRAPGA
jgi:uncharacterized protein with GYD domain